MEDLYKFNKEEVGFLSPKYLAPNDRFVEKIKTANIDFNINSGRMYALDIYTCGPSVDLFNIGSWDWRESEEYLIDLAKWGVASGATAVFTTAMENISPEGLNEIMEYLIGHGRPEHIAILMQKNVPIKWEHVVKAGKTRNPGMLDFLLSFNAWGKEDLYEEAETWGFKDILQELGGV